MEDIHQRRRRPAVTYGKSIKKRFSDVSEVFSNQDAKSPESSHKAQENGGAAATVRRSPTTTVSTKPTKAAGPQSKKKASVITPKPVQKSSSSAGKNGISGFAKVHPKNMTPPPPTESPEELASKNLDTADIFDFCPSSDVEQAPVRAKRAVGAMRRRKTAAPVVVADFDAPSTESDVPKKSTNTKKRSYQKAGGVAVSQPKRRKSLEDSDEKMEVSSPKDEGTTWATLTKGKQDPKGDTITSSAKVTKNHAASKISRTSTFEVSIPYTLGGEPSTRTDFSMGIVKAKGQSLTKKEKQQKEPKPPKKPPTKLKLVPEPAQKKGGSRERALKPTPKPTLEKESAKKPGETTVRPTAAARVQKMVSAALPNSSAKHTSAVPPPPHEGSAAPTIDGPTSKKIARKGKSKVQPRGTKQLTEELSAGDEFDIPEIEELRPIRRRRLIDTLEATRHPRRSTPGTRSASVTTDTNSDAGSYHQNSQHQQLSQFSQNSSSQLQDVFQFQSQVQRPVMNPGYNTGRNGPKVTYAQQRSFRADENVAEQDLFGIPLMMMPPAYGNRGDDFDEGLEEEPVASTKGMMKNIHELREAGINSRFLDDVEELFGDIEGKDVPLGTRRSGYIGLACKMADKTFLRNFRTNSLDARLLQRVGKQTDEVICFSLAFMIARLLWDDSTVQVLSAIHSNGTLDMLIGTLEFERDIKVVIKDKKTNMSKAAQGMAIELRALVDKSTVFPRIKPSVFSGQMMSLMVLETTIRKFRAAGLQGRVLPSAGLRKLVAMVEPFTAPGRFPEILMLELVISTLEAWACGMDIEIDSAFTKDELRTLTNVIPSIMSQVIAGDNGHFHVNNFDVKDILLLTLRLNINITNDRTPACDLLADSELIPILTELIHSRFNILDGQLEEIPRLVNLDLLVLGLGLLNNFAEMSIPGRVSILKKNKAGVPLLDILVKLFLARFAKIDEADSLEESQSNVGFGYLSILLGNLCQDTEIRIALRNQLPNRRLDILFDSMEVFIAHHRKVDELKDPNSIFFQIGDAHCAFTERLEKVVRRLKEGY